MWLHIVLALVLLISWIVWSRPESAQWPNRPLRMALSGGVALMVGVYYSQTWFGWFFTGLLAVIFVSWYIFLNGDGLASRLIAACVALFVTSFTVYHYGGIMLYRYGWALVIPIGTLLWVHIGNGEESFGQIMGLRRLTHPTESRMGAYLHTVQRRFRLLGRRYVTPQPNPDIDLQYGERLFVRWLICTVLAGFAWGFGPPRNPPVEVNMSKVVDEAREICHKLPSWIDSVAEKAPRVETEYDRVRTLMMRRTPLEGRDLGKEGLQALREKCAKEEDSAQAEEKERPYSSWWPIWNFLFCLLMSVYHFLTMKLDDIFDKLADLLSRFPHLPFIGGWAMNRRGGDTNNAPRRRGRN